MNMDYCLSELKALLSIDSPSGFTDKAADYLIGELTALGYAPERTRKGGVFCCLGGEGSPLVLMAHVDTLGGMISTIKPNGRITITPIGGLRAENCEAENCRIYSRFSGVYSGTLQLCNASIHVNGSYGEKLRTFETTEVVLDEPVKSADDVRALGIEAGDFVCFDPRSRITESGYIKSRFLDDKLSAAILLGLARAVAAGEVTLSRKVSLLFTVYEEVGHGGAFVPADTREMISVDMGCVGDDLGCTERMVSICAKDSGGPYNYDLVTTLSNIARELELDYAIDVYPHYGSDVEATLSAGYDIRHGLIGPGVYASHNYERSHMDGVRNTYELVRAYVQR